MKMLQERSKGKVDCSTTDDLEAASQVAREHWPLAALGHHGAAAAAARCAAALVLRPGPLLPRSSHLNLLLPYHPPWAE